MYIQAFAGRQFSRVGCLAFLEGDEKYLYGVFRCDIGDRIFGCNIGDRIFGCVIRGMKYLGMIYWYKILV